MIINIVIEGESLSSQQLWQEFLTALECFCDGVGWSVEYHLPSDSSCAIFADALAPEQNQWMPETLPELDRGRLE
ncbi:MAG: hypothetical protein KDI79_30675 [Anaerolineae bacterium]|nr:hypothetical protein [Anaerolineae bacterium]